MRLATVLTVLAVANSVAAVQRPFNTPDVDINKKQLTGRFLHITDFHPDPHYKRGATFESGCHRRDGKKKLMRRLDDNDIDASSDNGLVKKDTAKRWGTAVSDCDSPMGLVDYTFDWLKENWANEIDFIVWTGDNVRHDLDREIPRHLDEIYDLNRQIVQKFTDAFGRKLPIVPCIGNNDIWPHNVFAPGPNRLTEEFLKIWKHFIPEDERHVFERGLYFTSEVIPDRLAVISLNTLYWFASNSVVDGCKDRSNDPGALHMDWLEVQLSNYRDRGMQVWLIGHVPPHQGLYYDNCYLRYGDLALRYQDTIVGHLFGHMNVDHFFFMDVANLDSLGKPMVAGVSPNMRLNIVPDELLNVTSIEDMTFLGPELRHGEHNLESGRFKVLGKKAQALKKNLVEAWRHIPDPPEFKDQDYTVVNVNPSVIPTYYPAVRIYSYNISGVTLEDQLDFSRISSLPQDEREVLEELDEDEVEDEDDIEDNGMSIMKKKKKKKGKKGKNSCKRPENEDRPHCTFKRKPRYSSPQSPSRMNKPLSPLGWAQFYLPGIDDDKKEPPAWVMEYTTYDAKALLPESMSGHPKTQPLPVPLHLLPGYDPTVDGLQPADLEEVDGMEDIEGHEDDEAPKGKFLKQLKRITPWKMSDLTIGSYVKFARALASDGSRYKKFIKFMFVSSGAENEEE